jgi:hypothetical protein
MTAQTNQKKTMTLRPNGIAKTVPGGVYTSYDEERLLKVGNVHAVTDEIAVLGVFNVSTRSLSDIVTLREFPCVKDENEYLIRAYSTGELSSPMRIDDKPASVFLHLEKKGWDILTAYPLSSHGDTEIAALGLLGKMTGAAALAGWNIRTENGGRLRITVTVRALGILGKVALSIQAEPWGYGASTARQQYFHAKIEQKPGTCHVSSLILQKDASGTQGHPLTRM